MLWIKALHIISIITWFAALFYLPRLFVYHTMCRDDISIERFKLMQRRLYFGIMLPSLAFVVVSGGWLMALNWEFYLSQNWLMIKLVLVGMLIIYHFYCGYLVGIFQADKNQHSTIFYRWFNELPTIILVLVVILAVVKPF